MARKFKLGKLFRTTFGKPDEKDSLVSKSQRSKHSEKAPEVIEQAEEADQEPSEEDVDAAGEPELPNPPSEPNASPAKGMGKELSILSLVENSVTSNFPPSEVAEADYKETDYKLGSKSIQLHIHEAHDLGRGWKTDPYVLVVFSNNRVLHSRKRHAWSTRYIRRTRNPKWDEEATIPLTSGSAGSGQYLHFIVMTWGGKLKHDDILGRVTIDTHSPEFLKNAGKQLWYPLMRMKTDALAQGELSCSYRLLSEAPLPLGPASVRDGSRKSARDTHMGPRKRLEVYGSLNLRVRVTGVAAFQPSQIHKGIYVTIDTGTWAAKTRKLLSFQTSGAFDLLWNEEFAVAMEDALTPPKTKTTDAFLNNLLLREPRAFDDVVFKLKRRRPAKAHPELLGVAHVPLSTIPIRGAPNAAAARQTSALTPISSRPSTPARGSIVSGDDAWGPFRPAPSHDSEHWVEERGLSSRHPEPSGYSDVSTPQLNGAATNGHRKATSHEMVSPFHAATPSSRPAPAPPDRGQRWAVQDEVELSLAPRHDSSPELGMPQQGSRDDTRGKDPVTTEGATAAGPLPQLRLPASSAGQAKAQAGGAEHAASRPELPAGKAQDAADAAGAGDAVGGQGHIFERMKHGLEDMVQGLTRNLPDLGMGNGAGGPPKLDTTSDVLSMGEMEEHEEEMEEEEEEDVELEEIKLLMDRGPNKPALQLDVALAFEHSNLHQRMEEQEDDSSLLAAEKDPSAPEPKPMPMPPPHGSELVHETLPIGPHHLFVLLFSSSSEFYTGFHTRCNNRNLKVGNWKQQDGKKKRLVTYTMPLKGNSFGPKEAEAEETQSLEVREDGGWHVEVRASTPRVPYGSTFHNQVQFAAASAGRGRTELRITAYVEFYKSVMVRSLIEKASLEGLKGTYSTYLAALQDEVGAPVPGAASVAAEPSVAEADSRRGKQLALLLRSMEGQLQLALLLGVPLLLGLVAVPTRVMTMQEALSACHYLGLALLVLQVAALGSMALDRERRQRQLLTAAQPGADAGKAEAEARQPAPRTERQGGKGTFLLRRLSGSPAAAASEQGKKAESGRRLTGPKSSLGSVQED